MSPYKYTLADFKTLLDQPLPGRAAHRLMDPLPEGRRMTFDQTMPPRQSAVLILLHEVNGEWRFPLIQRPKYEGVHSGQIALPGGKMEQTDPDLIFTALRETEEEIGIDRQKITVLGQLSEIYIPPSNFNILPVVGYFEGSPSFVMEVREVEAIIDTHLSELINPASKRKKETRVGKNMMMPVPCFELGGATVWGATAMILSELAMILNPLTHE